MGVRLPSVGSNTIVNATIVTTAETVIVTSPPLNLSLDFAVVFLQWYINWTPGASISFLSLRVRRGTGVTGTVINVTEAVTVTPGQGTETSGCYLDTPGAVAAQQYSITFVQNGAGANGSVSDACLLALSL